MLKFIPLLLSLLVEGSLAVIYGLNESEYQTMPRLYDLDEYDSCLLEPGGVYCIVDVDLFSEDDSQLMHLIQGYSEHTMKHFNHTQIHRGVCVTKSCKAFEQITNSRMDLDKTVEGCVNDSLWRQYRIQGKLSSVRYCKRSDEKIWLDTSDVIVGVIYLLLILLNVSGSFYDILLCDKEDSSSGNPYLLSFSLRRNWLKLTASNTEGRESKMSRLKLFHGLRTMTMVCVFFSHTVLMIAYSYVDNPLYIEKSYEDPLKQILFNGSLVTHTFFVMSSFLLAYNFELYNEKHGTSWKQLPKGILLRWLRLTPAYALVLATISTWMRYLGSGPLWDLVVTSEATACRQYWWAHILYINNYVYDDAHCAPQTWYLAADTQLFCLGLLLCVTVRRTRSRKIALLIMFLLSLVIVAAHTYFQDLEAVVIQTPETYRSLYSHDDTFRLLYIRGHTNMSTYVLGLSGGFIAYYWQNEEKNLEKYKSFRWVIWLLFPLGVAVILSGGLFYADGAPPPTALRVLYATLYKPFFQLLIVIFIISTVFKLENVYRGIVEWRGFTWTGRVSYCGFLLHTLFQRGLVGSQRNPLYMSDYDVMTFLCATIFLSFAGGGALWLFVEAPLAGVVRAAFAPPKKIEHNSKV